MNLNNNSKLFSEFELSFARSSGPGGQNVNKVNSKVILKWNILESTQIPQDVIRRFIDRFKVSSDGVVTVASDKFRDQPRNIADCQSKVLAMIESVWNPPKKRIPTKPSRNQTQDRLTRKKNRAQIKKLRQRVDRDS